MKQIVKTKIISTKEQETAASKKKGRFLSALASGLSAGFGGGTYGAMYAGSEQDKYNKRHAKMEEVITFLVIYNDNSRETVDTVKNDAKYKELIMYLD